MKILIAEDDFMSRKLMLACLSHLGECDVVVNGVEAIEAFVIALNEQKPYDLVLLDIMMPEMNGQDTLMRIRAVEEQRNSMPTDGVKIIMTTALKDSQNIMQAFENQCDGYLVKPIEFDCLIGKLQELGITSQAGM